MSKYFYWPPIPCAGTRSGKAKTKNQNLMSRRSQFLLQYLHQGVNTTFPAILEMQVGNEIGSPLRLVLTSPSDLMFYFYCNITDQMLKTMCDNLLIDTQMVATFDTYLFPLLDNLSDKRTVCLEDDDRRTGFIFTVHDRLDFQRFYRLRLPFERASDRSLAEYLSGLLSESQKLTATQAAEISTLKSQNDRDSKNLTDRIALSQQDLQRKAEEFSVLSLNYSKQTKELEIMTINFNSLQDSSTREIASLTANVKSLQSQVLTLEQKKSDLERELNSALSDLNLARSNLELTRGNLVSREGECDKLRLECKRLNELERELERGKQDLVLQLTSLTERNNNTIKIQASQLDVLKAQNEEFIRNIDELKEAASALSTECDRLGIEYNTALSERNQLESKLSEVVESLSIKTEQVSSLMDRVSELSQANGALEAKISSDTQKLGKLSTALQTAHNQKTQAETKVKELTATVASQKAMIDNLTSLKGNELLAEVQDGHGPVSRKEILGKPAAAVTPSQQFEVLDLAPMLQRNVTRAKPQSGQSSELTLSPPRALPRESCEGTSFSSSDVLSQDTHSLLNKLGNLRARTENKQPRITVDSLTTVPATTPAKLQNSSAISVVGFVSKRDSPPTSKSNLSHQEISTSGDQYARAYMNFMNNID